jgi:hypothetical protein
VWERGIDRYHDNHQQRRPRDDRRKDARYNQAREQSEAGENRERDSEHCGVDDSAEQTHSRAAGTT